MVMRVVLILLFFFAGNVLAALPARYMQTTKDAAIWSQIGDKMVTVGNIRAGQILSVTPVAADYYALNLQSKCNKKRSTHQLEYNFVSTQKPLPNDEYFLPTSYNKRA
ncbi:hypothetical protein ACUX6T_15730, partial [Salmonella enterica]